MKSKRIAALLMALMILVCSLSSLPLSASAEEIETTDSYVLDYYPSALTESYAYDVPYLYITPFTVDHTAKNESSTFFDGSTTPVIFNLINTTKLSGGGDGTYASIAAYCTDAATGIQKNSSYRRINLEDSTYYASGAAGKIRAVFLNSFPYKDLAAIQARANSWLRSQGLPEIADLQTGEAILATQVAIWQLANGSNYTINALYDGWEDLSDSSWSSFMAKVVYTDVAWEQETETTAQNVKSLYEYLYNLDAVAPKYDAVSESSLESPVYSAIKEEDGTYTVSVSVNVNTTVGEQDALTLSATCGEQVLNSQITEAGKYSFTFAGLSDRLEVKLEINGYQHGGDVYLFDAEGERSTSQTLVGYDDSVLPVHGEVIVTPDRILNIFKSTSEDDGKVPLANIQFNIYQVCTLSQLENGEVTLSQQPTAEEIEKYQTSDNLIATLTTDVQGFATYNFTEHDRPDGVYMIVEQYSAATTGAIEPFFLAVPGTTADGNGYSYTMNVNPKNVTETGPDIQKDVTEIGNNSDTFDVGEIHTWIIRGGVPSGIGTALKYVISDTLDYRLTLEKGSEEVRLFAKDGKEVTLEDAYYTVVEGTVDTDQGTVDCFTVALTPAGMAYVAANLGAGEHTAEIRVYFQAVINENAAMGEAIPNQAHLDYTNSAGIDYDADSDIPEVHTGGINLLKTDVEGKALAGASFKIAREATEAELADETIAKETLIVGEEELTVVFVDFHASADLSGEKVSEVTTGEDGKAVLYGLAYGSYYIVETKAPSGYNLLTQPIAVTINKDSHLTDAEGVDNTLKVINTKFVLPETGGMGTTVFTVAGIAIIGLACMLLLAKRKKRT